MKKLSLLSILLVFLVRNVSSIESKYGVIPKRDAYIKKCRSKIAPSKCGKSILKTIVYRNNSISDHCCGKLVGAGKLCHDNLLRDRLSFSQFNPHQTRDLMRRSEKIWRKCEDNYFNQCIVKVDGKNCELKILESVLYGGSVDNFCCKKLVSMGRDCHDGLVKRLISSPEVRATDVFQVSKRGVQVWRNCVKVTK